MHSALTRTRSALCFRGCLSTRRGSSARSISAGAGAVLLGRLRLRHSGQRLCHCATAAIGGGRPSCRPLCQLPEKARVPPAEEHVRLAFQALQAKQRRVQMTLLRIQHVYQGHLERGCTWQACASARAGGSDGKHCTRAPPELGELQRAILWQPLGRSFLRGFWCRLDVARLIDDDVSVMSAARVSCPGSAAAEDGAAGAASALRPVPTLPKTRASSSAQIHRQIKASRVTVRHTRRTRRAAKHDAAPRATADAARATA